MRIAIFGAGGRTGGRLVHEATARGHEVIAIVRDPSRVETGSGARVVTAGAEDTTALTEAIQGADAVAFALGHNKTSGEHVLESGIRSTLSAMDSAGVGRIVAISASGHETDGDGAVTKWVVKPILGAVLRAQYADMRAMEEELRSSTSEWTIVRPPMLLDKKGSGHYRSKIDLNVRGSFTISRDDLATAVLDLLEKPTLARTIVSVAG